MTSHRMRYKIGLTEYNVAIKDIDASGNGSGIPVGTILPYSANSEYPPEGFLWCDGSAVSRLMYPDLFALIGTLYGEGDGVSTFNLPDLTGGKFLEGSDTVGTSHEAGLPNIEGDYGIYIQSNKNVNLGPYSEIATTQNQAYTWQNYAGSDQHTAKFDAGAANSIYGNSDTVQPRSITVRYIIKVFNAATPDSALVDMTQMVSDLANKADRSLSNLNAAGEARFAHVVTEAYYDNVTGDWYRVYADGWVEQGGVCAQGTTVTYLKPFADANYTLCATIMSSTSTGPVTNWNVATPKSKTSTGFSCPAAGAGFEFIACGMGVSA